MKAIYKLIPALAVAAALLVSCKSLDYPDRFVQTDGLPTVYFVRLADSDVAVTQASMDQVLCLVGDNLTSIHRILFNDQEAVLNTSYLTDHTFIVSVPKTLPSETTDKIYMYNKAGDVATYDFKVLPPAPKIEGMDLEWAPIGYPVTITGSYLFPPLTVEFPGADPIEVTTGDGSAVTVNVPEGAQPGKIKVVTSSGTAQSVFMYMDSRGMLFDFDGMTGLDNHGWNGHSHSPADETSISGNYFQFGDGQTEINDDSWNEDQFSLVYWPGSWNDPENYEGAPRLTEFADFTNFASMALKFEMMIPSANPWTCCTMQICFAGVDVVSYGNNTVDIDGNTVAGANNTYMSGNDNPRGHYRPWELTGSFDTADKWITVTIPFSEFVYGWTGVQATGQLTPESFTSMWIFVANGGVSGNPGSPIIKVDNIRAVPYK